MLTTRWSVSEVFRRKYFATEIFSPEIFWRAARLSSPRSPRILLYYFFSLFKKKKKLCARPANYVCCRGHVLCIIRARPTSALRSAQNPASSSSSSSGERKNLHTMDPAAAHNNNNNYCHYTCHGRRRRRWIFKVYTYNNNINVVVVNTYIPRRYAAVPPTAPLPLPKGTNVALPFP